MGWTQPGAWFLDCPAGSPGGPRIVRCLEISPANAPDAVWSSLGARNCLTYSPQALSGRRTPRFLSSARMRAAQRPAPNQRLALS